MNFDFENMETEEMKCARSLLEQALGELLLKHIDGAEKMIKEMAAIHTLRMIDDIMRVLDDVALDDTQCIEEIVEILGQYGLRTSRHDW